MFQSHIVAAGSVEWAATSVHGSSARWLPAADHCLVTLSRPVPRTDGQ